MPTPRILGIDYGEKRIGLAISDPLGITAHPLCVVEYTTHTGLLRELSKVVEEKSVSEVVVGMPKRLDNTMGRKAEEVMEFIETLRAELGGRVEVSTVDERFTTVQAAKMLTDIKIGRKQKRSHINAVSAQILLQTWMDVRKIKSMR